MVLELAKYATKNLSGRQRRQGIIVPLVAGITLVTQRQLNTNSVLGVDWKKKLTNFRTLEGMEKKAGGAKIVIARDTSREPVEKDKKSYHWLFTICRDALERSGKNSD